MPRTRPRLILLSDALSGDDRLLESLRQEFDIVHADSPGALTRELTGEAMALVTGGDLNALMVGSADELTTAVLDHVGEGAAVIGAQGLILWTNPCFDTHSVEVREQVMQLARGACDLFNQAPKGELAEPASRKYGFAVGEESFELIISPATITDGDTPQVQSVVAVLWDVTESRRLEAKIEAIDTAGAELMRIEAAAIRDLNMVERLKLLEDKIARYVRDLLNFDNFEIRLLDQETGRLELALAVGLAPLKIGEVIYAGETDNGISGYVAATEKSYICNDVRSDPLYRQALDNAASSLTVPLMLHDRIIGVFNVESFTKGAFTESDRRFAEIFARYVAMAMHILDLMVVERYTTNEQIASNVIAELGTPLSDIQTTLESLREQQGEESPIAGTIERLLKSTAELRQRVDSCVAGPRRVLGADRATAEYDPDPALLGKFVLVADNEDAIREAVGQILAQKGCETVLCADGGEAIRTIDRNDPARGFDLVVSDIKMPDYNGYEVFQSARDKNPAIKVILMTGFGYDPHHSIVRASQEGLNAFLFKPFKAAQLVEAVKKALSPEKPKKKKDSGRT